MKTDKKILPEIRLFTYKESLSKEWFIYWYENGKRIKKYKGINLETTIKGRYEAAKALKKEWEKQLKERVAGFSGTPYHKQFRKIMAFMDQKGHSWRLKTRQTHESRIKLFLKWNQREKITPQRIKDFLAYQASIGKKPNTVHGYYRSFKNIFVPALGEGVIEDIKINKVQGTPARYFSNGQVKFLRKAIPEKDPQLWLAVQFIYYCYIRPGELRLLKVGDIIFEDKKICIPSEISKNKKTQYVVIPDAFAEALETELLGVNPSYYVVSQDSAPVGKNWLKNRHQKLLKELHFDTKQYKLYSWKHTGAVMAAKSGVHIKQLQLQLRHHSLDQVNAYLRQMGVFDMGDFSSKMPGI